MRVRQEREQVGLQMDLIRKKHEADTKEGMRRTALSSAMHDIDLVVERGVTAPPLGEGGSSTSKKEQKKAEMAGLELLIMRVADQVCPRGTGGGNGGGGALKQIREFNAFLERAAGVLERNKL